ncbi:MAG: hypothetical protein NVS2B14_06520 [Chamaesiphon sp.]
MLPFPTRIICQTLSLMSLVNLPATASQVWVGTGRITEGIGQGGLVALKLITDRDVVKSLHGPRLNAKIQAGVVRTRLDTWRFQQCSQDLCVVLNRTNPKQTIVYRLHRSQDKSAE